MNRASLLKAAMLPTSLVLTAALVYQSSTAAFSVTTANTGNSWATGSVTLTDDDSGVAMFSATGLMPNDTGTRCIAVTYTGDVGANIRVYGTGTGTLATYLNLTIERGTGGSNTDCTGFTPAATIFNGTLSGWNAVTDYATGVGEYAVTSGAAQTSTFRITYTVQNDTNALSKNGAGSFTWEAKTA